MPNLNEVTISHSVGVKANLGNYESGDAHLSETEKWDVSDLKTDEEVQQFIVERRIGLKTKLDNLIGEEYRELKS